MLYSDAGPTESRTHQLNRFPNEGHFRRNIIARGLQQLQQPHDFVYPQVHTLGIVEEANDSKGNAMRFALFSSLKLFPPFRDSFFTGRIYKGLDKNGHSKLDSTFPIS